MSKKQIRIVSIAGARPNFLKIAPLIRAFEKQGGIESILVHTGQHYDRTMSQIFFQELGIKEPSVNLDVGSGTHAQQTAEIMLRFEPVLKRTHPDAVLVVGDVNSTIACGVVAAKGLVKLIHVEAGLRSFDRTMPEEINRVLTDALSHMLFCTEESGVENLKKEGIAKERVHLVGNVMIDSLRHHMKQACETRILNKLGLTEKTYAVLTLHRPSNTGDKLVLSGLLDAMEAICRDTTVVFPVHPRTRSALRTMGLEIRANGIERLRMLEPLGYLEFLRLMSSARAVLTDSGGIQEETTVLGVPCLTLRENTERPVTISMGTNHLVGMNPATIEATYRKVVEKPPAAPRIPPLWDGCAADRIAAIIADKLV
jgi:UDP-N-acetylglucosamine 2-epimerase (non-hydrolysing)